MATKHPSLNVPASIIISGVESERYWDIVVNQCGIKFVLMSYHYLQKKPKDFLAKRLAEHPNVKIFIDSGAHTFLTNSEKFEDKPLEYWEKYIEDYFDFIEYNKDYVFAFADLDIDFIVGQEQVDKWRDELFEPFRKKTGVDVCYIWHGNRGENGWEEMCRKYNYIGMSMENDKEVTVQRLMRRMKVAEKYNTRVHGMALTKTEILVRVPFFSADSTTWLVGQQYGELNWFNGRKMQRLSKDKWRRQYKTQLLKEPFNADWDRLINGMGGRGDTYELLRLNVIAYKLAEEYIRKRLKAKMYWLPNSEEKLDLNYVETPRKEWFIKGEFDDWADYLKKLRISPSEFTKDEAVGILHFFYIFIHKDYEELKKYTEDDIIQYVQSIISKDITDYAEAFDKLREYYIKNATGERQDFRGEDNVDEDLSSNEPKERDDYIEEDPFEVIDLSSDDLDNTLQIEAPKDGSMPEVEEYDEELSRHDITPVRDEKGRFLKGQKKVRKPKNIYSDKYPKLFCDTCYKAGDCPKYKPGYVCAYQKMFQRFDTREAGDVVEAMHSMVNENLARLQRAMIFETMDGGMITPEVTSLIDQNMKLLEKLSSMQNVNPQAVLQQRRTINSDGTETVDTSMNVNPSQGGILSQIFGGASKSREEEKKEMEEQVIDVDYTVEDGDDSDES